MEKKKPSNVLLRRDDRCDFFNFCVTQQRIYYLTERAFCIIPDLDLASYLTFRLLLQAQTPQDIFADHTPLLKIYTLESKLH